MPFWRGHEESPVVIRYSRSGARFGVARQRPRRASDPVTQGVVGSEARVRNAELGALTGDSTISSEAVNSEPCLSGGRAIKF